MATQTLGFEIVNNKSFNEVVLKNGKVDSENVYYIDIAIKALKLFDKFYMLVYDEEKDEYRLEEHDLVGESREIVNATPSEIITIEKNSYIRKCSFDCIKEVDQQNSSYQPIDGLLTSSSYLTIKTHFFSNAKDEPKRDDLLFYQNKYWVVEETSKTYFYTPKEKSVLHISLKAINK